MSLRPGSRWLGLFLLLLASSSFAETSGSIAGTVSDAESHGPLPGVTVVLDGTGRGTTADLKGRFELDGIKPGSYTLRVSMIGYKAQTRTVQVREGSETRLDIHLHSSPIHLGEVLVQAERTYSAASSRTVRAFDRQTRPSRTAHQMLQMAPGLVIAQHAGGGKAEQIFLRGFDADHGTDVALSVDGVPVNMVSHGHGQGYADLHFMIADVIDNVDVFKGPYFPEFGNFATAGAVAFHTRDHLEENEFRFEGGSFSTSSYTMLYQLPMADPGQTVYFAGNFYLSDGPFDRPQDFHRFNVFSKVHTHLSQRSTLTLDLGAFGSAWDASGQIPERALSSGRIDRWGAIDDFEGGITGRHNVNLTFRSIGRNNSDFTSQLYVSQYDFKLFSNFTFFLVDPVNGDMIEQTDDRVLFGINNTYSLYHNLGDITAHATLGGGLRADDTDVALWKNRTRERDRILVDAHVIERNFYLWAREELFLTPDVRLMLGLRTDYFTFNVEDHLEGEAAQLPHASGYSQDRIFSPKAALVYTPRSDVDLFVNAGTGFHSNDARNVVIDARVEELARQRAAAGASADEINAELEARGFDPGHLDAKTLPRATGGEVGARLRLLERINAGVAFWLLDLDREFVYVGDAGTTEESGRTRRTGVDLEARVQLRPWLWADADVNLSRGKLRDEPAGTDDIPLAPSRTSSGGVTARHGQGWEGSLRYRHIGERPANEGDSVRARGSTAFDLNASYRFDQYKIHLMVENLLDTEWNEAQFDTESRLENEVDPVSELHFTPGNPFNMRVGLSYFF